RHPERGRLLHALTFARGVNVGARAVIRSIADYRPAVVRTGTYDVQFVAALRAVFVRPQHARVRMEGEPLRIPVAVAPDLRQGAVLSDERVVLRHAAVVVQSHDRALVIRKVL